MILNRLSLLTILLCLSAVAHAKEAVKAAAAPPPTLAVLALSSSAEDQELADAAADALNTDLIASKSFTVVERRKIAQVIREQALGQAGVITEESAAKVGQLLGARLLVAGRLSHIGKSFRFDARMLDSDTAKVVTAQYVDFKGRRNLELAVKELTQLLVDGWSGAAKGKAGAAAASAGPPIDPARLQDATADVVKQLSAHLARVKTKLDNVDETGMATFSPGDKLVFPGMRLEVYGQDDVTGGRARKGYMLIQRADSSEAAGPTESESSPIATGDDVVSQPLSATVVGATDDVVAAFTQAIEGLPNFTRGKDKSGTPVRVELEVTGTMLGDRHLVAHIIGPNKTVLATYQGTVGF